MEESPRNRSAYRQTSQLCTQYSVLGTAVGRRCAPRIFKLLIFGLLCTTGCQLFNDPPISGKSPLRPLKKAPEQLGIDVVFARFPKTDEQASVDLWQEVDEQAVSLDQRRALDANGFRVGVTGSQIPPKVMELLRSAVSLGGQGDAPSTGELGEHDAVTHRRMLLREGQRGELVTSSGVPHFHVLHHRDGEVFGQTFKDGQAQFAIRAERTDDGRIRLTLTPEVHHGPFRQRYVPGEGMFRLDTRREKATFERLEIELTVTPGQIMVFGSGAGKPGSLGHRFFNDFASETGKLLMLRTDESGLESFLNTPVDDVIGDEALSQTAEDAGAEP